MSHGEGFLEILLSHTGKGLYLMDEPESALSTQRQLTLLEHMYRMANDGSQFIIATHSPIPNDMRLEDAPFWSTAQSQLLREERRDDADWAMVVDRLNVALHAMPE